jgi:hypothetical protein
MWDAVLCYSGSASKLHVGGGGSSETVKARSKMRRYGVSLAKVEPRVPHAAKRAE